jgi:hypothetical protein
MRAATSSAAGYDQNQQQPNQDQQIGGGWWGVLSAWQGCTIRQVPATCLSSDLAGCHVPGSCRRPSSDSAAACRAAAAGSTSDPELHRLLHRQAPARKLPAANHRAQDCMARVLATTDTCRAAAQICSTRLRSDSGKSYDDSATACRGRAQHGGLARLVLAQQEESTASSQHGGEHGRSQHSIVWKKQNAAREGDTQHQTQHRAQHRAQHRTQHQTQHQTQIGLRLDSDWTRHGNRHRLSTEGKRVGAGHALRAECRQGASSLHPPAHMPGPTVQMLMVARRQGPAVWPNWAS